MQVGGREVKKLNVAFRCRAKDDIGGNPTDLLPAAGMELKPKTSA